MSNSTSSWLPNENQTQEFVERLEASGYQLRSCSFGLNFVGHGIEILTSRAVEGLFAFVSREGERPSDAHEIVATDRFSNPNWFTDWTNRIIEKADYIRAQQ